ncbi:MAG: polyamine aminopropyltransferase [Candidatus Eremiobacteraeota bacterium]|nr:polyamine aminopropyltransferase [Candidatus Eremiobacteraeota bacterium]
MPLLILASVFLVATCGLVYELIAGALASYLLGDSVLQFSTVIGTYLFAMGVGSYLSKYVSRGLLLPFVQLQMLVGLLGGCSTAILYLTFGYGSGFRLVLYLLVFAIGMLVGLEIPLLLRLLKDHLDFKDLVSQVLALDYVGALVASILFPLFLVPQLGLMRTAFLFGMVNVVVAMVFYHKLGKPGFTGVLVQGSAILAFLLAGALYSTQLTSLAEEALYPDEVVLTRNTPYQRIAVTRGRRETRLYLNGNLQFASADEYRYHEALVYPALTSSPNPEHVLVLGGGDGLAVRELLKDDRVKTITLVELDPTMIDLFRNNPELAALNHGSLSSPKVEVIYQDAFVWLEESDRKFNVALVDFPDPGNYSVGKLYTDLFYRALKSHLTDDGVAAVQCTSPMYARRSFWCIIGTIESAGFVVRPYHAFVPSFGEWGFALISKSHLPGHLELPPGLKFLNPAVAESMFIFPQDMARIPADVNRLFDQSLVRYYQQDWSAMNN